MRAHAAAQTGAPGQAAQSDPAPGQTLYSRAGRLDVAVPGGRQHNLDAALHAERAQNARHMILGGFVRQIQDGADVFVGVTLQQQLQHDLFYKLKKYHYPLQLLSYRLLLQLLHYGQGLKKDRCEFLLFEIDYSD